LLRCRGAGEQKAEATSARATCSLLADLVERGLAFDDGLLVVCDGAKGLSAAVREVFGAKALIQRCTLHYADIRIMPTPVVRPLVVAVDGSGKSA
jgi:transposase-like protein